MESTETLTVILFSICVLITILTAGCAIGLTASFVLIRNKKIMTSEQLQKMFTVPLIATVACIIGCVLVWIAFL